MKKILHIEIKGEREELVNEVAELAINCMKEHELKNSGLLHSVTPRITSTGMKTEKFCVRRITVYGGPDESLPNQNKAELT